MSRLILIPSGRTDWHDEGRLAGDMDLPLNELGRQEALAAAQAAAVHQPAAVYSGTEEPAKATAKIVANELALKHRLSEKIREPSLGHWQGLTEEEFGERFSKVHRQWRTEPLSVIPPEGEALPAASERLLKGVESIRRRNKGKTVAIVLGRFAYALCRCALEDGGYARLWEHAETPAGIFLSGGDAAQSDHAPPNLPASE